MDAFTAGFMEQELRNRRADLQVAYDKIAELREYRRQEQAIIAEQKEEISTLVRHCDQWRTHYVALEAERDALLEALDKAHGGAENNPMRKPAYANPDALRIPAGPRKGQVVTMRDHIYFSRFAHVFKKNFASIYGGSWTKFMGEKIFR